MFASAKGLPVSVDPVHPRRLPRDRSGHQTHRPLLCQTPESGPRQDRERPHLPRPHHHGEPSEAGDNVRHKPTLGRQCPHHHVHRRQHPDGFVGGARL